MAMLGEVEDDRELEERQRLKDFHERRFNEIMEELRHRDPDADPAILAVEVNDRVLEEWLNKEKRRRKE